MAGFKKFKERGHGQSEVVHLGSVLHPCGNLVVMKIEHRDIPYPGSPVLFKTKQIGRVDEIFGRLDDAFAAVKLEEGEALDSFPASTKLGAYKEKFIARNRFMCREDVEKAKVEKKPAKEARRGENKRDGGFRASNKRPFNKNQGGQRFQDKKRFRK